MKAIFFFSAFPISMFFSSSVQFYYAAVYFIIFLMISLYRVDVLISFIGRFFIYSIFCLYSLITVSWGGVEKEGIIFFMKLIWPILIITVSHITCKNLAKAYEIFHAFLLCTILLMSISYINLFSGQYFYDFKNQFFFKDIPLLSPPTMSPANYSFNIIVSFLIAITLYKTKRNKLYVYLSIALVVSLVLSFTRIAILALIIGLIVFFIVSREVKSGLRFVFIIIILFSASYDIILNRAFYDVEKAKQDIANVNIEGILDNLNTSGRASLWETMLSTVDKKDMLIGKGIGYVNRMLEKGVIEAELHSDILRIFIDTGTIGIILYLLGIAQFIYISLGRAPGKKNYGRYFKALSIASIVAFIVTLTTDNSLNYMLEFQIGVFFCYAVWLASFRKPPLKEDAS